MDNTIDCPKCGSKHVKMFNPESLCDTAYPETPYKFDAVATTSAICGDCGHKCIVEGFITWQQPKRIVPPKNIIEAISLAVKCNAPIEAIKVLDPILGIESTGKYFEGYPANRAWDKADEVKRRETLAYHIKYELDNLSGFHFG
jgi:DNA-directed RNA polymerase subunit RPC12/RpoP